MRFLSFTLLTIFFSVFIFTPITKAHLNLPQVKSASISIARPPALTAPLPKTTAQSIAIFDPSTQTFLLESKARALHFPASLAKIATALTAYKVYSLDQVLQVKSAPFTIGSSVNFYNDDKLSVRSLLFALLISSGNDAAFTLAKNYKGGYTEFVKLMNQQAGELKLKNTHFSNASGLDDLNQYTTAHDLSLLASKLIDNPFLFQVVSTSQKIIFTTNNNNTYNLKTTNDLLGKKGVVGIKTGWTERAGENLITFSKRNGHSIIVVVLGSENRFKDSQILIDWAFANIIWG